MALTRSTSTNSLRRIRTRRVRGMRSSSTSRWVFRVSFRFWFACDLLTVCFRFSFPRFRTRFVCFRFRFECLRFRFDFVFASRVDPARLPTYPECAALASTSTTQQALPDVYEKNASGNPHKRKPITPIYRSFREDLYVILIYHVTFVRSRRFFCFCFFYPPADGEK